MTRPPINPITTKNNSKISYFKYLAILAKQYLDDKEYQNENIPETLKDTPISLDFSNYNELIEEYKDLTMDSKKKAWQLSRDFNMWAEYFSALANIVQKEYLDAETEKIKVKSIASHDADSDNVSNGKRLSNKDDRVVVARKNRNLLKSFYDELKAKVEFSNRAHYHCKSTYELFDNTSQDDSDKE